MNELPPPPPPKRKGLPIWAWVLSGLIVVVLGFVALQQSDEPSPSASPQCQRIAAEQRSMERALQQAVELGGTTPATEEARQGLADRINELADEYARAGCLGPTP